MNEQKKNKKIDVLVYGVRPIKRYTIHVPLQRIKKRCHNAHDERIAKNVSRLTLTQHNIMPRKVLHCDKGVKTHFVEHLKCSKYHSSRMVNGEILNIALGSSAFDNHSEY